MATDDELSALLPAINDLIARYGEWMREQVMILAGTLDDPDSFDAAGGKAGALGYYPVINVNGQTVYAPCLARLRAIALGSGNAETLAELIQSVTARIGALTAATEAAAEVQAVMVAATEAARLATEAATDKVNEIGEIGASVASAANSRDEAGASAALANRFANNDTDADIAGAPGARGAKFWSLVAKAAAATSTALSSIFENTIPRFYRGKSLAWGVADPNDRMLAAATADGTFYAKFAIRVGVANGLSVAEGNDGYLVVSLGTAEGVTTFAGTNTFDGAGTYFVRGQEVLRGIADSDGRSLLAFAKDSTLLAKLPVRAGSMANGLTVTEGADGFYNLNFGSVAGVFPIAGSAAFDERTTLYWRGQQVAHAVNWSDDRPVIVSTTDGATYVPGLVVEGPAALPQAANVGPRVIVSRTIAGKRQLFSHPKQAAGQLTQITALGNNGQPFDADGTGAIVGYATDRFGGFRFMAQAASGGFERHLHCSADWDCFGDSLTAGAGSTGGLTYPAQLATLLGRSVANYGIGGQTSSDIAARANAIPVFATVTGGVIPEYGPVAVTLSAVTNASSVGFIGSGMTVRIWLVGVYGDLRRDTAGAYTFARRVAGASVAVAAPSLIRVEPVLGDYLARGQIIWVGQNNNRDAAARAVILADIAAIIANGPIHGRSIIVGQFHAPNEGAAGSTAYQQKDDLNAALFAIYGDRFVNPHTALFNAYDPATATAQDTIDHNNGKVQTSLTADGLHLINLSYGIVAQAIATPIVAKGWN